MSVSNLLHENSMKIHIILISFLSQKKLKTFSVGPKTLKKSKRLLKMIKKTRKQTEIHFKNPMHPQGPDPYSLIRFQQGDKTLQLSCSFSLIFTRTEDEGVCACMNSSRNNTSITSFCHQEEHSYFNTSLHHLCFGDIFVAENKPIHMWNDYSMCVCVCACMVLNRSW